MASNLLFALMDAGGPALLVGIYGMIALVVMAAVAFLVVVAAVIILIVVRNRNKKKAAAQGPRNSGRG